MGDHTLVMIRGVAMHVVDQCRRGQKMKIIFSLLRLIGATAALVLTFTLLSMAVGDVAAVHAQGALVCGSPAPLNYWPLDESGATVFDEIINNYDASCAGGAACPSSTTGVSSNAQTFSATTQVAAPATPSGTGPFDWAAADSFSIEVWAKSTCTGPDGVDVFIGRNDPLGGNQLTWWMGCQANGRARLFLRDSGGISEDIQSTTTINDNQWHHIVGVRDGATNTTELYIDGSLAASNTGTVFTGPFSSTNLAADVTLGWYQGGFNTVGDLDEIAHYSQALTPAEVAAHYSGGSAGQPVCYTNTPPTAVDDTYTTAEDTPLTVAALGVLGNDTDPETTVLTATVSTAPANGTLLLNLDGSFAYTPTANFNGTDTFTYVANDGLANSASATVTITVSAVNNAPMAMDDQVTTAEDSALTIAAATVLGNDAEIDAGDVITITGVGAPANGTATLQPSSILYTPAANFNGVDTFSYTISDTGGLTSTATITVTVTPTNDAPVAVDDSAATNEDTPVAVSVTTNDSDIDGDPLVVSNVSAPANGAVMFSGGVITYTPNLDYNGVEVLTYTLSDTVGLTDMAVLTITVAAVNDAPVALDNSATTPANTAVTVAALGNDSDADADPLTITAVGTPASGIAVAGSSTITYTPNAGFAGTDVFTYTVSDGALTDTATVTVTVGVNSVPVAMDDLVSASEDTTAVVNVLSNDSDTEGEPLTVIAVGTPANGAASTDGTTVSYMPAAEFSGTDVFTYTIDDNSAGTGSGGSATATITVTVNAVNDAPLAVDDSGSTLMNNSVTIMPLANDSDIEGDTLTLSAVGTPGNGTAAISGTDVVYTPTASFVGTDSFSYTVDDGNGGNDTATITVTVTFVNGAPTAADDSETTAEDTAVVISVLTNDSGPQSDPLTVTGVGLPSNGTNSTDGATVTYTPTVNFSGTDTFTYTIGDGNGSSAQATVTVTVTAVNDAPAAADDSANTMVNTLATILALANDSDVDGDTLSILTVGAAVSGTTNISGTVVTYLPNADFSGTDVFTYTVGDGNGGSDSATVTMNVTTGANVAPIAADDMVTTDEDTPATITVLANDSDPNGDTMTVTFVSSPTNGSATTDGTSVTYTPAANFNGTDTITYTISDSSGSTDNAMIMVTVNSVNDPPVAINDTSTTPSDSSVTISVLSNDSDVDGDALTVSAVGSPATGTATTDGTGVTYMPSGGFGGTEVFTYTVSDGNGGTAMASITLNISLINTDPFAANDMAVLNGTQPLTIAVLNNDTDGDGDTLMITAVTMPANGTATTDGVTIVYTPTATFSGNDIFTYIVSDGNGGSASATIAVLATGVDSDNDTIADNVECPNTAACPDTDGDNIPDQLDPDDDNDGIPTSQEAQLDVNGNSVPDHLEASTASTTMRSYMPVIITQ